MRAVQKFFAELSKLRRPRRPWVMPCRETVQRACHPPSSTAMGLPKINMKGDHR
jgi:hypothetical protein